jgi:hypothetical protein
MSCPAALADTVSVPSKKRPLPVRNLPIHWSESASNYAVGIGRHTSPVRDTQTMIDEVFFLNCSTVLKALYLDVCRIYGIERDDLLNCLFF